MQFDKQAILSHLRENPYSPLFARYADLLLKHDRVEEAYIIAVQGVKADPKFATGWLVLGKAALRTGDRQFTKRCWLNALAADKMCVHAAELLLTTEGLDLQIREARIAATALLNIDSEHILAKTTMRLITEKRMSGSAPMSIDHLRSTWDTLHENDHKAIPPEEHAPESGKSFSEFDIYGTDKQNREEMDRTLRRVQENQSTSADTHAAPTHPEASHSSSQRVAGDEFFESTRHQDADVEKANSQKEQAEKTITIPARMATLTFVQVLKSQGLYSTALEVLDRIAPTAENNKAIQEERKSLHQLIVSQDA